MDAALPHLAARFHGRLRIHRPTDGRKPHCCALTFLAKIVDHGKTAVVACEKIPHGPRMIPTSRSRSWACERVKGSPWGAGRGQAGARLAGAGPGRTSGACERSRGSHRSPRGGLLSCTRPHGLAREDRRDGCGDRPRAPPPGRPGSPQWLTCHRTLRRGSASGVPADQVPRGGPRRVFARFYTADWSPSGPAWIYSDPRVVYNNRREKSQCDCSSSERPGAQVRS